MTDAPKQLGPYTVDCELGRGGMGVVYQGHDTRLNRTVAIKALPQDLAADPVRLERFEREARVLAQLNHPNIAGIHGVEEHEGARYLVLEFVEGETLADRLDRGPLPIDEAVELAVQIAAGVEAAHESGVIHRDLKPGNVMVTPDGRAKVLDFGLARTEEGQSSTGNSEAATLTSPAFANSPTIPGVILGTAAYMSPEQARGRRVDKRTDIWSFGVLLYEMCTGVGPFLGETVTDSIGAILHKNVDLDQLPPTTPHRVRRVIARCLQRDKNLRYRDIGDARIDLQSASIDAPPAAAQGARRSALPLALALLAIPLVAAAGWFAALRSQPEPPRPVVRFDAAIDTQESKLDSPYPAIAPDGSAVAFLRDKQIHVRALDAYESRAIPGTDNASNPIWSPDSKWIAYLVDGVFHKVALAGGGHIKLSAGSIAEGAQIGGSWTDDDRIIFASDGIQQISAKGGEVTTILEADKSKFIDYHDAVTVPGTDVILFVAHNRNNTLELCAYNGDRIVTLIPASESGIDSPCYAPSGHILFERGLVQMDVWAIEFDPETMTTRGDPFLVETDAAEPSVSNNGTLAIQRGRVVMGSALTWINRDGAQSPIEADFNFIYALHISPDGKHLVFSAGTPPKLDLWVHDLDRGINRRVTFIDGLVVPLCWSPDSREIAYAEFLGSEDDKTNTQFAYADGSGQSREPIEGVIVSMDAQWNNAVWIEGNSPSFDKVFATTLDNPETKSELLNNIRNSVVSLDPDAEYLVYSAAESGVTQVYCTTYPEGAGKWQISTQGGRMPFWSINGDKIYYLAEQPIEGIYEVEVAREPAFQFGLPKLAFDLSGMIDFNNSNWAVAPDGERLLFVLKPEAEDKIPSRVSIIENWFEAFRDR